MNTTRPLHSKKYAGTKLLWNPDFPYVKAANTDIRATFARAREQAAPQVKAEKADKVRRIK